MSDSNIWFPDINSSVILTNDDLNYMNISRERVNECVINLINSGQQFIIECDIYIPETLKFIPIPAKVKGSELGLDTKETKVLYNTGYFYNQVYNDIDIIEAMKVGIQIHKIIRGIRYT